MASKITANKVLATCAGLGGIYYVGTQMHDFKTPGIRNIEKRHIAAGGAAGHTPAMASKMGDEESTEGRHGSNQGTFLSLVGGWKGEWDVGA